MRYFKGEKTFIMGEMNEAKFEERKTMFPAIRKQDCDEIMKDCILPHRESRKIRL